MEDLRISATEGTARQGRNIKFHWDADEHGSLLEKKYQKLKDANIAQQHSSPKSGFLHPGNSRNPPFAPLLPKGGWGDFSGWLSMSNFLYEI